MGNGLSFKIRPFNKRDNPQESRLVTETTYRDLRGGLLSYTSVEISSDVGVCCGDASYRSCPGETRVVES